MNGKKSKKIILLGCCALLLCIASVIGTLAYFTSKDTVQNAFAVGKVAITLDEGKLKNDGITVDKADRVKENVYNLLPGFTYEKDPVVHVEDGSEDSWVFVKIQNDLAPIEDDVLTIASQVTADGSPWTALPGSDGVYYCVYHSADGAKDLPVFSQFKIDESVTEDDLAPFAYEAVPQKSLTITAYAIQMEGFTSKGTDALNAADAWAYFADPN